VIRGQVDEEVALLRSAWSLYRSESGALARALLIVVALVGVYSVLVLPLVVRGDSLSTSAEAVAFIVMAALFATPLSGGLIAMLLGRVREGRPCRARDVFCGYRRFVPLAVAGLLVGGAVDLRDASSWDAHLALRVAAIAVGAVVGLLLVYLVPTIVDRQLSLAASFSAAVRLLRPPELWRTLVAAAIIVAATLLIEQPASLLGHGGTGLATLYLLVVALAWIPFALSYLVSMYVRALVATAGGMGPNHVE
jgi:uncharacterized membrane protein YesL